MRQALLISIGFSKTAWTNWPNTRSMKPSPRGNISCRKAMCPPWAVSRRATLGRSWTVFSGKAVRGKEGNYQLKCGWETRRIVVGEHCPPMIFFCIRLTVMRREGVICCIEAQDGHCGSGEFLVWTRVTVIIYAGFVTKPWSREAFVKLADCPRLEEKRGIKFKKCNSDRAEVEKNVESSRNIRTCRT